VTRTKAVFDASAILRASVDEAADAEAWMRSLRDGRVRVVGPDLIYAEVANGLLQQVRLRRLSLEDAASSLGDVSAFPIDVRDNRRLSRVALPLAVETGLTAYDAHYLALAEAEDAVLVTADRALAEAATRGVLLE
jgi:predicted nucleic acid-binding protein